jgi:hypothetical protein
MGIPQEDSHRACAAHTVYLQWVAYPIDLTLLDRTDRFLRSYGGRGTHSSEQRCQWRETNHIRPGCCNKSRSHGSHWRVVYSMSTFNAERLAQLVGYCISGVQHRMLVLTAHSTIVTARPLWSCMILYCTGYPLTSSRLESGAIYCITAIFLVITVSVYDSGIHNTGVGVAEQLIVSPGSFSLI